MNINSTNFEKDNENIHKPNLNNSSDKILNQKEDEIIDDEYNLKIPFRCPRGNCLLYVTSGDSQKFCLRCKKNSKFFFECLKHKLMICIDECYKEMIEKFINQNKLEKKSKCLLGHSLYWENNGLRKCFICKHGDLPGIICKKCEGFFLCYNCSIYENKEQKKICFSGHQLLWNVNDCMDCLLCRENRNNGISCKTCNKFFICEICCDYKFPLKNSPNNHLLDFSEQKYECSRCANDDLCSMCRECKYYLCSECKDPFLKEEKKFHLSSLLVNRKSKRNDNIFLSNKNIIIKQKIFDKNLLICLFENGEIIFYDINTKMIKNKKFLREIFNHFIILEPKTSFEKIGSNLVCFVSLRYIAIWDLNLKKNIQFISSKYTIDHLLPIGSRKFLVAENSGNSSILCLFEDFYDPTKKIIFNDDLLITSLILLKSNIIAIGYKDSKIKLMDLLEFKHIHTFEGHYFSVNSLAFYNKNLLVSGSENNEIMIWDITKKQYIHKLTGNIGSISSLFFLRENIMVSVSSKNDRFELWDFENKKSIYTSENKAKAIAIPSNSFNSDFKLFHQILIHYNQKKKGIIFSKFTKDSALKINKKLSIISERNLIILFCIYIPMVFSLICNK